MKNISDFNNMPNDSEPKNESCECRCNDKNAYGFKVRITEEGKATVGLKFLFASIGFIGSMSVIVYMICEWLKRVL